MEMSNENQMREIKFRAWDKENNQWFHLEHIENQIPIEENQKNKIWIYSMGKANDGKVILMQYIGLYDKNHNPIYEGDIVKGNPIGWSSVIISEVFFDDGAFRINCGIGPGIKLIYDDIFGKLEIIGNIYENADLLEKNHE